MTTASPPQLPIDCALHRGVRRTAIARVKTSTALGGALLLQQEEGASLDQQIAANLRRLGYEF